MQRLTNRRLRILVLGAALGGLVGAASMRSLSAQQGQRPAPPQGYITGVVRSDSVPEAGVWVIAETKDPKAGWKGRALYANYGTHFVWHIEGGKGTKGKLVKFQLRPDPLAR